MAVLRSNGQEFSRQIDSNALVRTNNHNYPHRRLECVRYSVYVLGFLSKYRSDGVRSTLLRDDETATRTRSVQHRDALFLCGAEVEYMVIFLLFRPPHTRTPSAPFAQKN